MPTNRVPTAVISVDSKMAAAMMAEPINTDTEVPNVLRRDRTMPLILALSFLCLKRRQVASLTLHFLTRRKLS